MMQKKSRREMRIHFPHFFKSFTGKNNCSTTEMKKYVLDECKSRDVLFSRNASMMMACLMMSIAAKIVKQRQSIYLCRGANNIIIYDEIITIT